MRKRRRHRDDDAYKHAEEARERGEAVSLREVLEKVRETYKGEIIGISYERKDDQWLYEIKMLFEDGRYLEIYVDAKVNKIVKVEGE